MTTLTNEKTDATMPKPTLTAELAAKYRELVALLQGYGRVMVAFSGGVDSTLLLKVAWDTLGENVLAVTKLSPLMTAEEREEALSLARMIGARQRTIETNEPAMAEFAENTPERCYICRLSLCKTLKQLAREEGFEVLVDGANTGDLGDYRPGMRAVEEMGVLHPLVTAGFNKQDIRQLAAYLGLPNWNRPSASCLATRVPYGTTITPAILRQVEVAERYLKRQGFSQVRVRYHQDIARIEVLPDEMSKLLAMAAEVTDHLRREAGFHYVTMDLLGFRSGSMNEVLAAG